LGDEFGSKGDQKQDFGVKSGGFLGGNPRKGLPVLVQLA